MTTRKDDNAFPVFDSQGLVLKTEEYTWEGLTKREYFAAMALQGILANDSLVHFSAASVAVKKADELIKELNNDNEENS